MSALYNVETHGVRLSLRDVRAVHDGIMYVTVCDGM